METADTRGGLHSLTRSPAAAYGLAFAAVAAAVVARLLLEPLLGDHLPFITLFAAVAFAARYAGRGPALAALVAGAVGATFFLLPPRYTFAIDRAEDRVGLALYAVVGVGILALFESLRKAHARADEGRRRLEREVVARRLAERAASEREGLLRVTLASIGDGVITTDAAGLVTYLNPVAERLTGWSSAEARSVPLTTVFVIVNETSRQPVENPVEKAVQENRVVGLANHTVLIARDGTEYHIDDSAAPIHDDRGGVVGGVLVFRDISERREQEAKAVESAERFRLAAEAVDGIIYEADLRTGRVERTRGLYEVLGHRPDEVPPTGAWWAEQIHPDDRDRTARVDARHASARSTVIEYRVRHRDGRWLHVEDRAVMVRDDAGTPVKLVGCTVDVTERKRAEVELRAAQENLCQSEQRFRTFAEHGPQMVWAADADGVSQYLNPRWCEYTGLTPEQTADPDHLRRVIYPDDYERMMGVWSQAHATGVAYEVEFRIRRAADGAYRWFLCRSEPVRDGGGRIVQWVGANTDIEDQKRAEDALRRSVGELRTLMDTLPIGVFIAHDSECRTITGNPAAHALLRSPNPNLSKSAPDGDRPTNFRVCRNGVELPPDQMPVQRAARGEEIRDEEIDDVFEDGTVLHTLMSASPLLDGQGRVRGAVATVLDVTARKRAEDALRESEARFRLALRDSGILVYTTDSDLRYTWMHNPHPAFRVEDVIGRRDDDLLPPERVAPLVELKRRVLDSGVGAKGEFAVELEGKEHVYTVTVEPLYAPNGSLVGVTAAAMDITHRKEAERRIQGLVEELRQTDRRKDEFLATLAHELRNPLAPIRTGLQLLRLSGGDAVTAEKARTMMERQLTQLVRLVDDLMDVSRINQGKLELRKERVDLAAVLNSAVETSRPLIESMGHDLKVTLPGRAVVIDADFTRLAQVFMNLLNNAAKYSDRNGRIWLTAERQGSDAVVSVRDAGIGIAADHLPRLFELFSQVTTAVERSQGGLGIGLSLVKRLVEMHGGRIEARSEGPGKGSEFVVRLPVDVGASVPPDESQSQDDAKTSLRVLIVDDNEDSADSLSMMLKILGNETRTAYDGEEAVSAAGAFRPDVILLDIGLPKLNGYEACRRIRAQPWGRHVVLIAQTGWGQDDDRRRTHDAGFDHHMVKPVDPQALMKLLAGLSQAAGM